MPVVRIWQFDLIDQMVVTCNNPVRDSGVHAVARAHDVALFQVGSVSQKIFYPFILDAIRPASDKCVFQSQKQDDASKTNAIEDICIKEDCRNSCHSSPSRFDSAIMSAMACSRICLLASLNLRKSLHRIL